MKRNFTNFVAWNPTFLILEFYRRFGTLDPKKLRIKEKDIKKDERYEDGLYDEPYSFKVSLEDYVPFLKTDGEIPSMEMMCDLIRPFSCRNLSSKKCDGRANFDFVAGYAFTEKASNLILDYIDRFRKNCTADEVFQTCCDNLYDILDDCRYDYDTYDEDKSERYTRFIDESALSKVSVEDIITSARVKYLFNHCSSEHEPD